jgi:CBS domain-containing protein
VTSLLFAGLFAVAHQVVPTTGAAGVIAPAAGWLAWMNVMLGAFNLIPAAPLDGGRVLRALLWRRSGDRVAAATTATRCGEVFAYLLVAFGVVEFLSVGIGGVWFAFLGWYLLTAARAEEGSIVLQTSLDHVRVRDIMTAHPETFEGATTVADLLEHQLHTLRFTTFPLTGADAELIGLTTLNRVRRVAPDERAATRLVDTAASLSEVPTAGPDEPASALLQRLSASEDHRALVLEGGDLVGIVSPSDIARFVQLRAIRTSTRVRRRGATAG